MNSPASNNDKDPYEVKCHIKAQCVGEGQFRKFKLGLLTDMFFKLAHNHFKVLILFLPCKIITHLPSPLLCHFDPTLRCCLHNCTNQKNTLLDVFGQDLFLDTKKMAWHFFILIFFNGDFFDQHRENLLNFIWANHFCQNPSSTQHSHYSQVNFTRLWLYTITTQTGTLSQI